MEFLFSDHAIKYMSCVCDRRRVRILPTKTIRYAVIIITFRLRVVTFQIQIRTLLITIWLLFCCYSHYLTRAQKYSFSTKLNIYSIVKAVQSSTLTFMWTIWHCLWFCLFILCYVLNHTFVYVSDNEGGSNEPEANLQRNKGTESRAAKPAQLQNSSSEESPKGMDSGNIYSCLVSFV